MQSLILAREFLQLKQNFDQFFEILPATTDELRQEVYRVRHRVYCEELGWEPVRDDGMEADSYDPQSLHILLRSRNLNEYVGCVRLIRCHENFPSNPLPFEEACAHTLDERLMENLGLARDSIAEVSRLAVDGRFRRRTGEQRKPVAISDEDYGNLRRPRFPYIPVGLYLGMLEAAQIHGIDTLFMLTEPWLAQHFRRLGVRLEPIGAPIEHRGQRVPSMMSVSVTIRSLHLLVRPLYHGLAAKIRSDYDKAYSFRRAA
ncbi:PEP-CTERM/exosortase system-associated acyltransferase [Permianibacter sp. IMCC34836]|nr:PEP-CTERM/exosortase system-associated acyltransferase [Permianibacter fluminis]